MGRGRCNRVRQVLAQRSAKLSYIRYELVGGRRGRGPGRRTDRCNLPSISRYSQHTREDNPMMFIGVAVALLLAYVIITIDWKLNGK